MARARWIRGGRKKGMRADREAEPGEKTAATATAALTIPPEFGPMKGWLGWALPPAPPKEAPGSA